MRPLILDLLDDFDFQSSKVSSTTPQPILFIEKTTTPTPTIRPIIKGIRHWNTLSSLKNPKARKPSTDKNFQLTIDVSSFEPEEISVKLVERDVVVEGKHEEREDEHGFISRQFKRRFTIPEEYDTETLTTCLNKEGKMTIKALKLRPIETKERIIPIKRVISSEDDDEENEEEASKKKKVEESEGIEKEMMRTEE